MKNQYRFSSLNGHLLSSSEGKDEIFFKMHTFIEGKKISSFTTSLEDLDVILQQKKYYIAHSLIAHKGKNKIFKGEIAIATKENLMEFIKSSIDTKDLRNLLISPIFEASPMYVIYGNEDEQFFVYQQEFM